MGCIKTTPNSDGLSRVMSIIPAHSLSLSLSIKFAFLKECERKAQTAGFLLSRKGECGKNEEFRRVVLQ